MPNSASFTPAQIAAQVNKISRSSTLKNSPVLCQFLQFVVDETLGGNGERIKEYTIGTKVLGRKSDFDPQLDAIVRIHAGRLRRALNEFYSGEGKGDVMRISIPKGGYTPSFTSSGQREDFLVGNAPLLSKSRKPVLAIMPFRSLSQDGSHDSFSEEIGEFASTELARFQELSVISYSSCVNAANKFKDILEISSSLGAEYILTGSIFADRKNLRMLLQLSRCDSGKQLWSHTFTRRISDGTLFDFQEEIINVIAASLGGYYGVIYRDVIDSYREHGDSNAYSAIVWFDQFLKKLDRETFDRATVSLEETVEKDPEYALAWAVLSEIYSIGEMMGYRRLGDQAETALFMANKAVKLDPSSQHAYQALACACFLTRDKMKVISACDKCIALNTRAVTFSARVAIFLIYAGEYERGVKILRESLELNPFSPMPSVAFSLYYFQCKEYQESWNWAEKADMPLVPWVSLIKAASLAQLGKFDHAKKEVEILLITKPDITVLGRTYISSFVLDEELVDNIITSLEKIGLVIEAKTSLPNSELTVN